MKDWISEEQAFQRLAALCARGEHCSYDMQEKMRQWGLDEDAQAKVIERLERERYIDNARYAAAFVRDKVRYNQWGRRKVEQALWMKHIDAGIARQALDEISDDEYVSILKPMLKQKRRSTNAKSEYELNIKLMKWAMGRGFTMDIIRQCMTVDEDADEYLD